MTVGSGNVEGNVREGFGVACAIVKQAANEMLATIANMHNFSNRRSSSPMGAGPTSSEQPQQGPVSTPRAGM